MIYYYHNMSIIKNTKYSPTKDNINKNNIKRNKRDLRTFK